MAGVALLFLLPTIAVAQNTAPALLVTDALGNTLGQGDGRTATEMIYFSLDIVTSDAEGDAVTVSIDLLDPMGRPVTQHNWDPATGVWSWTPSQPLCFTPAELYSVQIEACDPLQACSALSLTLSVVVLTSLPVPGAPTPVAPAQASTVATTTPTLVVDNPTFDVSAAAVGIEYELYYFDDPLTTPGMTPDQTGYVALGAPVQTAWVPLGIPEDTLVYWRSRSQAVVCTATAYSAWTNYWRFFVNATIPMPLNPVLVAPAEGEVLDTLTPELTANNTMDPEGNPIELHFEVAVDDTFSTIVATSPAIPQDTTESFTSWILEPPLDFGASYAARAYATNQFGAQSPYSNIRHFRTRDPAPPSEVVLIDLVGSCDAHLYRAAPEYFDVSQSSSEASRPIAITLEIRDFDTGDTIAVTSEVQEDVGTFTRVPIEPVWLVENARHEVRVRAQEGSRTSPWTACNFWLDALNQLPGAVTFVQPEADQVFPAATTSITLEVANAFDADAVVPGNSLRLALCASLDPQLGDCGAGPLDWDLHPMEFGPGTFTTVQLSALTEGSYLSPDLTVHLAARAVDERNGLGQPARLTFSLEATDPCEGVSCGTGEVCDPATASCIPDGTCGGCPEGSVCGTDGLCQETGDPDGCGCDASGTRPGGARLLLGLGLLALLVRSRRRRG